MHGSSTILILLISMEEPKILIALGQPSLSSFLPLVFQYNIRSFSLVIVVYYYDNIHTCYVAVVNLFCFNFLKLYFILSRNLKFQLLFCKLEFANNIKESITPNIRTRSILNDIISFRLIGPKFIKYENFSIVYPFRIKHNTSIIRNIEIFHIQWEGYRKTSYQSCLYPIFHN